MARIKIATMVALNVFEAGDFTLVNKIRVL